MNKGANIAIYARQPKFKFVIRTHLWMCAAQWVMCHLKLHKNFEYCSHFANDKNVGEPGGKAVADAVFNVHYVKRARMLLSVGDHTNTPQVSTSGHHAHVAYSQI